VPGTLADISLGRLSLVRGSRMNPDLCVKHLRNTGAISSGNGERRGTRSVRSHAQVRGRADVDA